MPGWVVNTDYFRGRQKNHHTSEIQFSEITPDYNQREQRMNILCVNDLQQKPMVTRKLIRNKKHNNEPGSLKTSRIRKGVPAFPAGGSEARRPFTPSLPSAIRLGCHSGTTDNFPGTTDPTFRFPQNLLESRKRFFCLSTLRGYFLPPVITPHLHPAIPWTSQDLQARRVLFRPCSLAGSPGCWGRRLRKANFSRGLPGGGRAHGALTAG